MMLHVRLNIRVLFVTCVAVAAAAVAARSAQTLFAQSLLPLYGAASGGSAVGSVTPGTPMSVASAGSGREAISIDGWSQQGGDTVLYSSVGQRIVLATLNASGLAQRQVVGTSRDAYDNTWNHVRITGYVDGSALVADANTVWTAARRLYSTRCSACHALHPTTDFTANQWPGILQTMEKNAALDPQQSALITQYLQTHARTP